ncbi:MAG: LamG-like jellyroll fold domain-containing protein [Candidatus Methylacidiphilales bacterium]
MQNKKLKFLILFGVYYFLNINNKTKAQVICNQCAIANPINTGLVACYPFSGNAQDQSGFNNHGTNFGAVLTTDRFGNSNSAYSFNGSSYILVPNSTSLSSPSSSVTIAFWANTSVWSVWSGVNYGSILSKSNSATTCQYRVSLIGTGISGIINNKIWDYFIGTNELNKWDFFVVIMNNNTLNYYKNGVFIGQNSSPSTFSSSTNNPLYIGKDDPGFTDYYTGKIDDIRIYNRALTYSEVVTLYNFQNSLTANAGQDKIICIGDSVQLNGSGGPKYKWDNGTFLSNDTIANPFTRTLNTKDYILTVSDGVCEDKDTVKITIESKPLIKVTGNKIICLGDSTQLNAIGANKFIWSNGIYLNSDTISNPIAKPSTNTTFIVQGFIGSCSNKDTITINVSTLTPNAGLDKSICIGDSVQLNASGGLKYEWLTNNTLSDTSIYNPIAKPTTNTKYYVLVSDGTCKRKIDSVQVFVISKLITDAGKDTSFCKSDSIQLTAIGGSSFIWTPSTGLSQNNIPNPKASPTTTTDYILTSQSGSCLSSDTIQIIVNEKPSINAGLDKTICKGESYLINAISNADNFTWSPNYFLDNYLLKNPTTTTDTSLQYVVKAENSSNRCINFDTVKITVNNPNASFKPSMMLGIVPLTVIFNNTSTPKNTNNFWDFGNSDTSSLTNPSVTYNKVGKYKVTLIVTDTNNCKDTTYDEIIVNGSIRLNIPNVFTPNYDNLNDVFKIIFSDSSQIENVTGTIWNRWGGLIYELSYPTNSWWDGTYNGNYCSEGIYFYIFSIKTIYGEIFEYHGTVTLIR